MVFLIVSAMSVVVLRLQTRWRWKTIVWVSVVVGLVCDFSGDLVVYLNH